MCVKQTQRTLGLLCEAQTTRVQTAHDDRSTDSDVDRRHLPEREPIQRRVTVGLISGHRREAVVCRIDHYIACTRV